MTAAPCAIDAALLHLDLQSKTKGKFMGLFSSGSLDVHLEKKNIGHAEPLQGRIHIELPSATEGCTLKVELIGRIRKRRSVFDKSSKPWKELVNQEQVLFSDTDVEAGTHTHEFSFSLPDDLFSVEMPLPDNMVGNMLATLVEHQMDRMEYDWDVYARLVVPGLFNDLKGRASFEVVVPEDQVNRPSAAD